MYCTCRLWTYEQLQQTGDSNLKTRALNLKAAIAKADWVPDEFSSRLRTNGENNATIRWILEVQSALVHGKYSPYDFGLPNDEQLDDQYYDGELPSIKKTKKSILASSPKKGPKMHETTS